MTREAQEEMEKLGQRTWQLTQKATGGFWYIFFRGRGGVKNLGFCVKNLPSYDILLLSILLIHPYFFCCVIVMIIVHCYHCRYY